MISYPFASAEKHHADGSHPLDQVEDQTLENRNITKSSPYNTVRYEDIKPNPVPAGEATNPAPTNATYSPEKVTPLRVPTQTPPSGPQIVLPTDPDSSPVAVT